MSTDDTRQSKDLAEEAASLPITDIDESRVEPAEAEKVKGGLTSSSQLSSAARGSGTAEQGAN